MVGLARMRSSNATISMTSTSTASAEHEHDEEKRPVGESVHRVVRFIQSDRNSSSLERISTTHFS